MNIPAYLQPYAAAADVGKHSAAFRVKCSCGCDTLQPMSRTQTLAEKEAAQKWQGYTLRYDVDKDQHYMEKGQLLFKKKELISEDEAALLQPPTIVKAHCTACGKDILLFDETEHGYDASDPRQPDEDFVDDAPLDTAVYAPLSAPGKITVALKYDISFKAFVKDAEDTYEDDFDEDNAETYYDLAFSTIEIKVEADGRKKTVFTQNTAETWM